MPVRFKYKTPTRSTASQGSARGGSKKALAKYGVDFSNLATYPSRRKPAKHTKQVGPPQPPPYEVEQVPQEPVGFGTPAWLTGQHLRQNQYQRVGYPSYYQYRGATVPGPYGFTPGGARGRMTPDQYRLQPAPPYNAADKSTWTTQDWYNYAMNTQLNPPTDQTGVFFNPSLPKADVFKRDEFGNIIYNPETGMPEYESQDFTNYLLEEGVVPHFGPFWDEGYSSGAWIDYLLTRMGYSGQDRYINPVVRPQPMPPQQQGPDTGYGGGGGYRGGGSRGGRGGGGGGGGGQPSTPTEYPSNYSYGPSSKYMGYQNRNQNRQIPDWMMAMVRWNI